MKTKVIIDTNILLYDFDSKNAYHKRAHSLLSDLSIELFVTTKNISEFFAVASKMNIPFTDSFNYYQNLKQNCQILTHNAQSIILFETLLQKYQPRGNRIFDLEIVAIAIGNNISDLATINERDFVSITEINLHPF
jgi:predicted nucleic acid-binding protein